MPSFKCSGLSDNEFEHHLHNEKIIWNCQIFPKLFKFGQTMVLLELQSSKF